MKLIRESAEGLTSAQLAFGISLDKTWDRDDNRFQAALADKISKSLDKKRRIGRLQSEGVEGAIVWKQVF